MQSLSLWSISIRITSINLLKIQQKISQISCLVYPSMLLLNWEINSKKTYKDRFSIKEWRHRQKKQKLNRLRRLRFKLCFSLIFKVMPPATASAVVGMIVIKCLRFNHRIKKINRAKQENRKKDLEKKLCARRIKVMKNHKDQIIIQIVNKNRFIFQS